MGKHTDHTKPIDGLDNAPGNPVARHRLDRGFAYISESVAGADDRLDRQNRTAAETLAAEYRGMGISPELARLVTEKGNVVAIDSRRRPRWKIRKVAGSYSTSVSWRGTAWHITDREDRSFTAWAVSFTHAIDAVDALSAAATSDGLIGIEY